MLWRCATLTCNRSCLPLCHTADVLDACCTPSPVVGPFDSQSALDAHLDVLRWSDINSCAEKKYVNRSLSHSKHPCTDFRLHSTWHVECTCDDRLCRTCNLQQIQATIQTMILCCKGKTSTWLRKPALLKRSRPVVHLLKRGLLPLVL